MQSEPQAAHTDQRDKNIPCKASERNVWCPLTWEMMKLDKHLEKPSSKKWDARVTVAVLYFKAEQTAEGF